MRSKALLLLIYVSLQDQAPYEEQAVPLLRDPPGLVSKASILESRVARTSFAVFLASYARRLCFITLPVVSDMRTISIQIHKWNVGVAGTLILRRRQVSQPRYGPPGFGIASQTCAIV